MGNYIYALCDHDDVKRKNEGTIYIAARDVGRYNKDGYGIFRSVQSFKTDIRKKENLDAIVSFAVDLDDDTKLNQFERIIKIGVEPSRIVETKNGFHVYFDLKEKFIIDASGKENIYTKFLDNYMLPLYNACDGSKDVSRILRVPGYYHCKNLDNKFMVKLVHKSSVLYTSSKIFNIFTDKFEEFKKEFVLFRPDQIKSYQTFPKNSVNKSAREIAFALGAKKTSGNSFLVSCPCHDDKDPSFHITQKGDKTLFHCFGGCSQESVLSALKERNLW
jgi:hypothetical protein